jgi:hypothetical protein
MKSEDVTRTGLLAVGLFGVVAGAAIGFAAGMAVSRDPDLLRRTVRRAARGLEGATLLAAQAREHVGDLWAEAREAARAEVDARDFERAAQAAAPAAASSAAGGAKKRPAKGAASRKRASRPRKPRAKPDAAESAARAAS